MSVFLYIPSDPLHNQYLIRIRLFTRTPILFVKIIILSILAVAMIGVMIPSSDAFITHQIPSISLGTIDQAGHTHFTPGHSCNCTSTFDSSGNLWVAESNNNRVVKYPVDNLGMFGYYTIALGQYNLGLSLIHI